MKTFIDIWQLLFPKAESATRMSIGCQKNAISSNSETKP